jgi:hypothetical protein
MSELEDLETYEVQPIAINGAAQAASRRNLRKAQPRLVKRSLDTNARRKFYAAGRQEPSLPKFKCLED